MKKIGLIGFGCVGQGVFNILKKQYPEISIKNIVVKDVNKKRPTGLSFTYDPGEIILDEDIEIIIEAIDDAKTAFEFAKKILEQGKTLITANKKMVAEYLPALVRLQKTYGGKIHYEGAVCGSIPIIHTIKDYYKHEQIKSITGILNGSTNYILTLMSSAGVPYEFALKEAQVKGFAESDPTLDVEGIDAANKLSILCYEAFGEYLAPHLIQSIGITGLTKNDLNTAKRDNKKIKLIASASYADGRLLASVKPHFISSEHPLYWIDNEYNSIIIEGEYAGKQQITGKGAGSFPTGLAVVADALRALKKQPYPSEEKKILAV